MVSLLVLKSSLQGEAGKSNVLVTAFVEKWQAQNPDGKVVVRDLAANSLPHLTGEEFASWVVEEAKRSSKEKELAKLSDDLIAEFKAADSVVVGMPMYNFGIPSTFKAWLDRICRAGQTFNYTATGPVPLVDPKKVYILCARGGMYVDTPNDSQTPYLRSILGLVGQTDLSFVYAEGMNMGAADTAIPEAKAKILELFA